VIYILELLLKFQHLFQKDKKKFLEEFNEIESNKPDPIIKSFFEKAKKFWKNS
jgi:hypothetical protein